MASVGADLCVGPSFSYHQTLFSPKTLAPHALTSPEGGGRWGACAPAGEGQRDSFLSFASLRARTSCGRTLALHMCNWTAGIQPPLSRSASGGPMGAVRA